MLVITLYLLQDRLLYAPIRQPIKPTDWHAADLTVVDLKTQDGLTIFGWYKAASEGKPTLLFFHGNTGHLGSRLPLVRSYLNAGFGVLMVSYHGFAGNAGHPSEQVLYQDATAGFNFLRAQNIPNTCIIAYGESLGTGVAVELATKHALGGIILLSPYTSIPDVAQNQYPYIPARFLVQGQYNSLAKIAHINTPLVIVHGTEDKTVPYKFGQRLYQAAKEPKLLITLNGEGHQGLSDVSAQVLAFFNAQQVTARCQALKY